MNTQNRLSQLRKRLFDLVNISDEGYELEEVDLYSSENDKIFSRDIIYEQILCIRQQNEISAKIRTSITQNKLTFLPDIKLHYRYNKGISSIDWSFISDS